MRGQFDHTPHTLPYHLFSFCKTFLCAHKWLVVIFYNSFLIKIAKTTLSKLQIQTRENILTEIQKLENSNFDIMMGSHDILLAANRFKAF